MNFFYTFFSLLLLIISQSTFAQTSYHTIWYSSDSNHLPQNSVKAITPDKYGYLWLSTENGLVRYNGQNFKVFNLENIKNITSNRMTFFRGNPDQDSIITLNEKAETILINNRTVKRINKSSKHKPIFSPSFIGLPGVHYARLNDTITIRTGNSKYIIDNKGIKQYNSLNRLLHQYNYTYKDSAQFFFNSGNLFIINKNNNYTSFSDGSIKTHQFDNFFSKKSKVYTNVPAQQCFIYSNKQLFYIKSSIGKITALPVFENFDLNQNNIVSVYYDEPNDILYLGSSNKGLLIIKKQDFKHNATPYYHSSGTDDVYYALAKYSENSIIASSGEIFAQNGNTSLINIDRYSDKFMLISDNNGDLWTKRGIKLYCFDKKSGFKKFRQWKFKNSLTSLFKAPDGKIWIGMFNNKGKKGSFLYNINPEEINPDPKLFLKLDFAVATLNTIDDEVLWCGSWKGLYKITLKNKTVSKVIDIPNVQVRSIYCKNPNEIWVCTYGKGFFLHKNNKTTAFPIDKEQFLLTTHCIIEDKTGFFWITTNKGMFLILKQDLLDYADSKLEKVYYHAYNKNAGFKNNEFNGGCNACGIYLNSETIFFPSMNGIVYFNPEKVKNRLPENDIYINEIDIDHKTAFASDTLTLSRNFEKAKFFINSPYFGNAYNQNIETKLEGPIGQDWTPMTEDNVSFSNLPPGNYTLKARKLSGFGSQWITKDFNFTVAHAFWQTGWFTALMITLSLLLIYFVYKLRIRYIKYKNVQLQEQVILQTQQLQNTITALRKTKDDLDRQIINHKNLIKTITHDIKSPLKFMAITGRFIYNNFDKQEATLKDDIQAMHTSSAQLYHFVDNFLEYAKETDINNNESEPYLLHNLIDEKIGFFKNIALAAKTSIINNTANDLYLTINKHLLSIILHNLLDNAIKNTFDGVVTFETSVKDKIITITVKDTGNGMNDQKIEYYNKLSLNINTPKPKYKEMGLHMIIELLAIMEGKINISSTKTTGTTISLFFTIKD